MCCLHIFVCYICVCSFICLNLLSSPYLPVFGDDRVRGTPADVDAGGAGDT